MHTKATQNLHFAYVFYISALPIFPSFKNHYFSHYNYVIDVIQTYCLCMSLNPGPLTCKSSTLKNYNSVATASRNAIYMYLTLYTTLSPSRKE